MQYPSSEMDMSSHRKGYEDYLLTRVDLPKLKIPIGKNGSRELLYNSRVSPTKGAVEGSSRAKAKTNRLLRQKYR